MSMTAHDARGVNPQDAGVLDPDGSIGRDIAAGHTLPSSWYTDDAVFRLEQQLVFRRSWAYVGHREQVSKPGDYFTCEVGGVPIVVVCGRSREVRAFVNICRHRHHPVAIGDGNRPMLQCRYHAWTYKLDGSFNGAPRSREDATFDGTNLCLSRVGVGLLGGMVFVNPSGDAPSLAEVLAPVAELGRKRGFPFDEARFQGRRVVEFDANWKIAYDNNCECYHCPTVHTSWYQKARLDKEHVYSYPIGTFHFEVVMDQHENSAADYSLYCWPAICITTSGGAGKVQALEELSSGESETTRDHPGYFAWRFVPVTARTSRLELDAYSVVDLTEAQLDEWFEVILSVVNEDRDVCGQVQRSHDSGAGAVGTLIPAIDSEYHTQVWQRLLYRALQHPDQPLYAPMLERARTWPEAAVEGS